MTEPAGTWSRFDAMPVLRDWEPVSCGEELLGREAVAHWGTGGERGRGKVIGYSTEPMVIIQLEGGEQIHWVQSLVSFPEAQRRGRV